MIVLGLTGSIGMGKSTSAQMFARLGAAVYDADAAVHRLYRPDGAAVAPVGALFPDAVRDGAIDRAALGSIVQRDPAALAAIEGVVHRSPAPRSSAFGAWPRERPARRRARHSAPARDRRRARVDAVVVASAPAEIQRARVLARPGMTAERFEMILGRQMADAEKRRRAHFIVGTGRGLRRLSGTSPISSARSPP